MKFLFHHAAMTGGFNAASDRAWTRFDCAVAKNAFRGIDARVDTPDAAFL